MRESPTPDRAAEINGYLEIGMAREALELSSNVLSAPRPNADEIRAAIAAIGTFANDMSLWRGRVDELLVRLPKRMRHAVREAMVVFYFALDDNERVASFAVATRAFSPHSLFCVVSSLVVLDRSEEALEILQTHPASRSKESDSDFVAESWALVLSTAGRLSCALNHRMNAKCDSPISRHLIEGGIESGVALLASWLGERIEQIADRRRSTPDSIDQLTLPGNDLALLSDEEAICRRWRQRFAAMIPKRRRWLYPWLFGSGRAKS